MLAIKNDQSVKIPCTKCIHMSVCNLAGKMQETHVTFQDDHFSAVIECSEFIPLLEDDKE